jgi:hypothetical protein
VKPVAAFKDRVDAVSHDLECADCRALIDDCGQRHIPQEVRTETKNSDVQTRRHSSDVSSRDGTGWA